MTDRLGKPLGRGPAGVGRARPLSTSMRALVPFALLGLVSCAAVAYEPLRLPLEEPLDAADFARVADALRPTYPSLAVEAEAGRAQSAWEKCEDHGWPARRRVALFLEEDRRSVGVVVEVQHYKIGLLGDPEWTAVRGHARFERQVVDLLRVALGA